MSVHPIETPAELAALVQRSRHRLVVVDFYADWCGPCRALAPFIDQLATRFPNTTFCKVNVDRAQLIAGSYGIRAMPTLVFLKGGAEVGRVQGADVQRIEALVQQHDAPPPRNPASASSAERRFLERFTQYPQKVADYEDEVACTLCRSVLPSDIAEETNKRKQLEQLVHWFKVDFFEWMDAPNCDVCDGGQKKTRATGKTTEPTQEEIDDGGAARTELFECEGCKKTIRFPRYNEPTKLIQTRTGRCGEWANCFAQFLVALGFETRWVLDVTDHVWVEVLLDGTWTHVDPCEALIDRPLVYELGWKKKLSYVLAFAKDHIRDVTWRYSADQKATLQRRKSVREHVLDRYVWKMNERLAKQRALTQERKKDLTLQLLKECAEMLRLHKAKKQDGDDAYKGRQTGAEEWRRARGEIGDELGGNEAMDEEEKKPHVFEPTPEEVAAKEMIVTYDVRKDEYRRGGQTKKGFLSWIYEANDAFRKEELDHKMVYLCRKEGAQEAIFEWHIDLSKVERKVKRLTVQINGVETFHQAAGVDATLCLGDQCHMLDEETKKFEIDDPPKDVAKIWIRLSGGDSYQHAQLFRRSLKEQGTNGGDQPSMRVHVEFE